MLRGVIDKVHTHHHARVDRMVSRHELLLGLWIDGLVEINPKDARKKCQHGGEGQENHDGTEDDLGETPTGKEPEYCRKSRDEGEAQSVADVHGAEEISRLAVEEEIAGGAAIIHLGEAPVSAPVNPQVNVRPENSTRSASRTELSEDAD